MSPRIPGLSCDRITPGSGPGAPRELSRTAPREGNSPMGPKGVARSGWAECPTDALLAPSPLPSPDGDPDGDPIEPERLPQPVLQVAPVGRRRL